MAQAKRKKRMFNIELPLIKRTTQLVGYETKDLNNRDILYDLTRILKGKGAIIRFKLKVEGDQGITTANKFVLMPYHLKRIVRKGTDYVEESFTAKCKDSEIRIKPLLVTRRKVSREVKKALREKTKEEIMLWLEKRTSQELFEDILKNKIQKELSLKLKKVYPLSVCEIKALEVSKFF